jgi:hypothetical protein
MDTLQERMDFLYSISDKRITEVEVGTVGKAFRDALVELVATGQAVSMEGVNGAPDWYVFETECWNLSETIRKFLRRNRELRGQNELLDVFASVAADRRFGKGRQNLVLMLAEFGKDAYARVIGQLLSDNEVLGHAIKALIRGKIQGYSSEVSEILNRTKIGWIRSAAKKYLSTVGQIA